MKKEKIVLYTERWCSGGIESLLVSIIEHMNSDKFKFEILVSQKESDIFDNIINKNNCIINETLNKKYKNPVIRTLKNLCVFKNKIAEKNIDIIHINIYNSVGLIYAYIAKKVGIEKIIVHAHNSGIDKDKFKIKELCHNISKKIFDSNEYIHIACSQKAGEFCFNNLEEGKFEILNNGIDVDKYVYNEKIRKQIRNELNIKDNLVFGHIGRFVEQKNHNALIDIFYEIHKKNNNARLLLIGEGALFSTIKEKVDNLGLKNIVIFLGVKDNINELMQAMDIFIFPSLYEGLGIVAIEAQSSGLKCFVSNQIPEEVMITNDINRIDLNETPKKISEIVLNSISYERKDQSEIIKKANYDIKQSIKNLNKIYCKDLRNKIKIEEVVYDSK